ncbi:MAG TPA: hypothetical protein VH105_13365 [Burkholderiales bacterium]|jgi:hypothetical protein|nr:hypothetical protein [Burkholderiales bacterium]
MAQSVFVEVEFFLMVLMSVVVPVGIYGYMMWKRAISRPVVLLFGLLLLLNSGIVVGLLRLLERQAKASLSPLDDRIFASEITLALYLLPVLFAGIGVNVVSHVLLQHLGDAERRYTREHK